MTNCFNHFIVTICETPVFKHIQKGKVKATNCLKIQSLFGPFWGNRASIGHWFFRPFNFLHGPCWVIRPNFHPIGNAADHLLELKRQKTENMPLFGPFLVTQPKFGRGLFRPYSFYLAPFDLCGRTFGQLATLTSSWNPLPPLNWMQKKDRREWTGVETDNPRNLIYLPQ